MIINFFISLFVAWVASFFDVPLIYTLPIGFIFLCLQDLMNKLIYIHVKVINNQEATNDVLLKLAQLERKMDKE